jgi:MFS family permease
MTKKKKTSSSSTKAVVVGGRVEFADLATAPPPFVSPAVSTAAPALASSTSPASSPSPDATRLHDYHDVAERIGFGPYHLLILFLCGWGNAAEAIEILCVSFVLPELEASSVIEGWIGSSVFLGMMLGGVVFGPLADKWGRRPVLIVTLIINALAGAGSGFVPSAAWLIPARFVCGVGVGGAIPAVWTYFAEFLPVKNRGAYMSCLAAFWMAGSIATAVAAWAIVPRGEISIFGAQVAAWRVLLVVLSVPSAVGAALQFIAPESPKWLYGRGGRHAVRAVETLTRMHRFNARWSWLFCGLGGGRWRRRQQQQQQQQQQQRYSAQPPHATSSSSSSSSPTVVEEGGLTPASLAQVLDDPHGSFASLAIVGDSSDPRDAVLIVDETSALVSSSAAALLQNDDVGGGSSKNGGGNGNGNSSSNSISNSNGNGNGNGGGSSTATGTIGASLAPDVAPSQLHSAYLIVVEAGVAWKIAARDRVDDLLTSDNRARATTATGLLHHGGSGGNHSSHHHHYHPSSLLSSSTSSPSPSSSLSSSSTAASTTGTSTSAIASATATRSPGFVSRQVASLRRTARTLASLWKPPHLRTTFLLTITWFSLSFGYYGLTIWTPEYLKSRGVESKDDLYKSSFLVAISQLPGNVIATLLMDRVGRGKILAAAMAASACCTVGIAFIKDGAQVVALMCIFSGVSIAGWNALDIVSAELYPCSVRSAGFGALTVWARAAAISGIHLFGAMVHTSPAIPATIICGALFCGSFAALLLPKTDGVIVH